MRRALVAVGTAVAVAVTVATLLFMGLVLAALIE